MNKRDLALFPVQVTSVTCPCSLEGYLYCMVSRIILLQVIKKVAMSNQSSNHAQSLSSEQAGPCTVSCAGYVRYLSM